MQCKLILYFKALVARIAAYFQAMSLLRYIQVRVRAIYRFEK